MRFFLSHDVNIMPRKCAWQQTKADLGWFACTKPGKYHGYQFRLPCDACKACYSEAMVKPPGTKILVIGSRALARDVYTPGVHAIMKKTFSEIPWNATLVFLSRSSVNYVEDAAIHEAAVNRGMDVLEKGTIDWKKIDSVLFFRWGKSKPRCIPGIPCTIIDLT